MTDTSEAELADQKRAALEALESGNPSLAYELYDEYLQDRDDDSEAIYGAALAAARLGSISVAEELLAPMLKSLPADPKLVINCLSLTGRLEKDRFEREKDAIQRQLAALRSARAYAAAYERGNDYYPGANAATMYLLAGDTGKATELVARVLPSCLAQLTGGSTDDPWLAATLGELYLLNDERQAARDWYHTAALLMGSAIGNVASMRRQLRLLSSCVQATDSMLEVLSMPTVITVTGHMIDAADAKTERFPAYLEDAVKQQIEQQLEDLTAGIGYCSAACGVDILFAEAMLARGGEVHIFLPFAKDDFITTSVAHAGEAWVARFERVIEDATSVRYATLENYLGDDLLFSYNADVITGEMLLRAELLEVQPKFLALYDFESAAPVGGTRATADSWQAQQYEVTRVDLGPLRNRIQSPPANNISVSSKPKHAKSLTPREIRAMVFADVVGFSKLGEADTPHFFVGLLGAIAKLIESYAGGNEFKNTWGDGLFLVFDRLPTAAAFALELRDLVNTTDWSLQGLPEATNIRIALHVGPVYPAMDPIIRQKNFFGSHVNQTARMEPITAPGSVFVSDQAAALIRFQASDSFACDYLGPAALPKDAGTIGLHRLRRVSEIE